MSGNAHVRFLGERVAAMPLPYPPMRKVALYALPHLHFKHDYIVGGVNTNLNLHALKAIFHSAHRQLFHDHVLLFPVRGSLTKRTVCPTTPLKPMVFVTYRRNIDFKIVYSIAFIILNINNIT